MIKACIFDLDGVIVDTAHYHFLAWQRLAHELGVEFTETDNERLKGVSRMRSLEIILEIGKIQVEEAKKEALATKKNAWFVDYVNAIRPEEIFPGVKELIGSLKSRGLKIALASSSKNAHRVTELLNIQSLFDVMVDGTMITHSKPDPEIFLLAASKLNIVPSSCVVFEDAEAGVEAALAAGMRCVGVGSPEQLGKAHDLVARTGDYTWEKLSKLNKD
jgi:beta-phosphoglucomutase